MEAISTIVGMTDERGERQGDRCLPQRNSRRPNREAFFEHAGTRSGAAVILVRRESARLFEDGVSQFLSRSAQDKKTRSSATLSRGAAC